MIRIGGGSGRSQEAMDHLRNALLSVDGFTRKHHQYAWDQLTGMAQTIQVYTDYSGIDSVGEIAQRLLEDDLYKLELLGHEDIHANMRAVMDLITCNTLLTAQILKRERDRVMMWRGIASLGIAATIIVTLISILR